MPQVVLTTAVQIGGLPIQGAMSRSGESSLSFQPTSSVPAGKSGTLTTRTDDNTGTLTLSSGHGITTGQVVSLAWAGGYRYGVTVGTVSGTSVPIDLGVGDNLPVADTAIVVCVETSAAFAFDGDDVQVMSIFASQRMIVQLQATGGSVHLVRDIPAGEAYSWFATSGFTNPVAGDAIANIVYANVSASAANLAAGVLMDV